MKEVFNLETIKELLKAKSGYYELIDNDEIYISMSKDFDLFLNVKYEAVINSNENPDTEETEYDTDTLEVLIRSIYVESGKHFIPIEMDKKHLTNLSVSHDMYEEIKQQYEN